MNETDFEGSMILEQLASQDLLEDFYEAVDSDNLGSVIRLLRKAEIDEETIRVVLKKIEEG